MLTVVVIVLCCSHSSSHVIYIEVKYVTTTLLKPSSELSLRRIPKLELTFHYIPESHSKMHDRHVWRIHLFYLTLHLQTKLFDLYEMFWSAVGYANVLQMETSKKELCTTQINNNIKNTYDKNWPYWVMTWL